MGFYSNVFELQADAANQLNISGSNFVVYLFSIDDNMRLTQLKKAVYLARD